MFSADGLAGWLPLAGWLETEFRFPLGPGIPFPTKLWTHNVHSMWSNKGANATTPIGFPGRGGNQVSKSE